jgi:hypothetical protein
VLYHHLEGRRAYDRKPLPGFVDEGRLKRLKLHSQKHLYQIALDMPYSNKLAITKMLWDSEIYPLMYDLGLQTADQRFYEPVWAGEINPVPGWGVKGRLDSDLRRVVLKHLLRGIFLTFIESDANLEEDGGSFATQYKLKWVLDPGSVADPARLRRTSQKSYFRILEKVWTYLGVKSIPHKTTRTGALLMIDLNALFSVLHTREGRILLHEALQEASQHFKKHAKSIKKIHEPLVYPKLPKRSWLQKPL